MPPRTKHRTLVQPSHSMTTRKRVQPLDDSRDIATPPAKVNPLDFDEIKNLVIAMPPGIISPRAGMTPVKLSPMVLHRVPREAVDADADTHTSNAPPLTDAAQTPSSRHSSQDIQDRALKRLSDNVYPLTPSRSLSPKKVYGRITAKRAPEPASSAKQQVLSFEVKEWIYTGKLWDVYRGSLLITGHTTPPLSLVLKIMKPMSFNSSANSEDDEESSFGALSYHPAEYKDAVAAVKAAYNEDTMYHHLLNFQGTVVPNYHGLFVWPSEDDTQEPGLMAMLLEDLGEQIPPEDMDSIDVSEEECEQIQGIYKQLHDEAKIVHGFPQLWHILRRKEIKPGEPNHLVVIDFANARSLSDEALSEKQRGRMLKLDRSKLAMSFSTHKW